MQVFERTWTTGVVRIGQFYIAMVILQQKNDDSSMENEDVSVQK